MLIVFFEPISVTKTLRVREKFFQEMKKSGRNLELKEFKLGMYLKQSPILIVNVQ